MIACINLFFAPMISVYISEGKKEAQSSWISVLISYMSYVFLNFIAGRIPSYALRFFFHVEILEDTGMYALFAFTSAVVCPFLVRFFRERISVLAEEK